MLKRIVPVIFALLLLLVGAVAVYALNEISQLRTAIDNINQEIAPPPSYAMWSVGTGGDSVNPYVEWVALYPESTLYPIPGAPSLKFSDQAPVDGHSRDFEIGFYRYGPTWYTRNSIIEFWIGDGQPVGGVLSIAGNDHGGGEIQVRNPTDTDGIRLMFHDADTPTITTETGIALHFAAREGLISESRHTFQQGIAFPQDSPFVGKVTDGAWNQGVITVPTTVASTNSHIMITPLSQPKGTWWISTINDGESFQVSSSSADEDMNFNWLIISTN